MEANKSNKEFKTVYYIFVTTFVLALFSMVYWMYSIDNTLMKAQDSIIRSHEYLRRIDSLHKEEAKDHKMMLKSDSVVINKLMGN